MATRFTKPKTNYGVPPLPSGYDSETKPSLTIPSVGLEDVDKALFELFNKEISPQIMVDTTMKKVPIIFAAGEKWALLKNGRALRDKNQSLILPLITIIRTGVEQDLSKDIAGRGINQQTGEIVVKRRLDKSDRTYQGLINRLYLKNQQTLAVGTDDTTNLTQLTTERTIGDLSNDPTILDGGLLMPNKEKNVYETIVMPSPQFYTANYEVTIWTQFTQHKNVILEQIISSFLPQGQNWKIESPKGYWFLANVQGNSFDSETNVDDMSQEERVIKCKFMISVPAYLFGSASPGLPIPIKRYVSSPSISFDVQTSPLESTDNSGVDEPFLGADDPTLPINDAKTKRRDQRDTKRTRLFVSPNEDIIDPNDPALQAYPRGQRLGKYKKIIVNGPNGKKLVRYIKILNQNSSTGETVYSSDTDLGSLSIVVVDD